MRQFVTSEKRLGKCRSQWVDIVILFGLLGFTQIQCSEAPSQTPSATTSSASISQARSQPAVALASETSPVVNVSTPLLASNETFIKVAKNAMASVVNISATKRAAEAQENPFRDDPSSEGFLEKNLNGSSNNHGNDQSKALVPESSCPMTDIS